MEKEKSKETGTRLKILLVKPECSNENDIRLIKHPDKFDTMVLDGDIKLFYKSANVNIPKWYKNFFEQTDCKIKVASGVSAVFFKSIELYQDEGVFDRVKFAICFGSGDQGLYLEKFDDRFGLRIALNVADKFYKMASDSFTSHLSKKQEQAAKPMDISEFAFDYGKDMLNVVTISPKVEYNKLTTTNITGGIALSISTTKKLYELDDFLATCYKISFKKDYSAQYPFIDNIKELKQDKQLQDKLNLFIVKAFKDKEVDKAWVSVPEIIEWEDVSGFEIKYNKDKKCYDELNSDNVYDFIENYAIAVDDVKVLKKIKISIQKNGVIFDDKEWSVYDCIYAQIEWETKHYVLSNKRYYEIDGDYVNSVKDNFSKVALAPSLPPSDSYKAEADYIDFVCQQDDHLINMDCKFVIIDTKIEICDIFDKFKKEFIHLKKGSNSAVLSHLFSQVINSAKLFANDTKDKLITKIKESYAEFDGDEDKRNYGIVLGIITHKEIKPDQHVRLPFLV